MNDINVHYGYVHFRFPWSFIKDKQIVHEGNYMSGTLMILDNDDRLIKVYAYELVKERNEEE